MKNCTEFDELFTIIDEKQTVKYCNKSCFVFTMGFDADKIESVLQVCQNRPNKRHGKVYKPRNKTVRLDKDSRWQMMSAEFRDKPIKITPTCSVNTDEMMRELSVFIAKSAKMRREHHNYSNNMGR